MLGLAIHREPASYWDVIGRTIPAKAAPRQGASQAPKDSDSAISHWVNP